MIYLGLERDEAEALEGVLTQLLDKGDLCECCEQAILCAHAKLGVALDLEQEAA